MMNHAPQYLDTMEKLVPLLQRLPKYKFWEFEPFCDWMAFYWNRGTVAFSVDDEKAHGVCIIKLFSRFRQLDQDGVHDPYGPFCKIEAMIADSPQAMRFIHDEFVDRWGRREILFWDRQEKTENKAPRMFRWHQFEKLARRLTHG